MFAFLHSWNVQEPWVKLCLIWLFITACPLLLPVWPSWKLLLLCQISGWSCCGYIYFLKKCRWEFFFFFLLWMGCRNGWGAELHCSLRNALLCNREETLSCWRTPCGGCLEQCCLRQLFLTLPGSEILDLKTDTLICKECLNALEKIDC